MRHLVLIALCLGLIAPADAQGGSLRDRARRAAANAADRLRQTEAPAPTDLDAPSAAPDSAANPTVPDAEAPAPRTGPAPGVDMLDLLKHAMPAFDTGRVSTYGTPITAVFPAEGTYELAVLDAGGGTVAAHAFVAEPVGGVAAFAHLDLARLDYEPMPGDYRVAVRLDGAVIGAVPFTLTRSQSDDPFNPVVMWGVEGPWDRTGVLSFESGDANAPVELTYWVHPREMSQDRASVRVRLFRDGTRVSAHEDDLTVFKSYRGWTSLTTAIHVDNGGRRGQLRRDALADGDYRVEIVEDGAAPFRTFRFTVDDGQIVPHERSALDYTPRADFLTPRSLRRSSNRELYEMVDRVWLLSE
ncbi:hypothetical protein [Rubrivirga sp. IMCC43871]|uniref:hypothetical protein n=1 Tax=Rubrivirga sp. IMCC43871 TaxID=3391575 RepID=UPI00398FAF57